MIIGLGRLDRASDPGLAHILLAAPVGKCFSGNVISRIRPVFRTPVPNSKSMKSIFAHAMLAALVASASAYGQTEAKTKPVGYETITLNANQFNVIGLRLQGASVAGGALDTIGTTSVTDNEGNFASTLSASKTYILEITSGTLSGLTVEATWTSGNVLNTPDNLSQAGITAGTTYNLRPALTLEEIFGTTNSVLTKGLTSVSADVVWIPNGVGGYNQYYLSNASTWKNANGNALAPNIPIVYTDGVFVQKRGSGAVLTLSGEVKTGGSTVPLVNGFNLVSTVYPAGATLQNLGLEDDVQKGLTSVNADIIWVPDGTGNYKQYFLNNSNVWKYADNTVAPADVALTSGILIQRKGASKVFTFTSPSAYGSL